MTPVIQGSTTTELLKETWYQNHSEPESVNSLWFPTPLFSSTYDICCIKTHVHVCLCCVSVYSWGSFHWWRLPGLENGRCTESRQLLCWHRLQNWSAKRAHVLPPRPGTNYIKSYIEYITYNVNFMSNFVFVFVPSEWQVSGGIRQRPCSSQYWKKWSQVSEDIQRWQQSLCCILPHRRWVCHSMFNINIQ